MGGGGQQTPRSSPLMASPLKLVVKSLGAVVVVMGGGGGGGVQLAWSAEEPFSVYLTGFLVNTLLLLSCLAPSVGVQPAGRIVPLPLLWAVLVCSVQCCSTSTETVGTIRDRRSPGLDVHLAFHSQLLSSHGLSLFFQNGD